MKKENIWEKEIPIKDEYPEEVKAMIRDLNAYEPVEDDEDDWDEQYAAWKAEEAAIDKENDRIQFENERMSQMTADYNQQRERDNQLAREEYLREREAAEERQREYEDFLYLYL